MAEKYKRIKGKGICQTVEALRDEFDRETALSKKLLESLTVKNGWFILSPRILSLVMGHYKRMDALFHLFSQIQQRHPKNETTEEK